MGHILTAEVEKVDRSIVYIDVDKFLASEWGEGFNPEEDDEKDFIKERLWEIGVHDLLDPCDDDEYGIRVQGDYDDQSISVLGII